MFRHREAVAAAAVLVADDVENFEVEPISLRITRRRKLRDDCGPVETAVARERVAVLAEIRVRSLHRLVPQDPTSRIDWLLAAHLQ